MGTIADRTQTRWGHFGPISLGAIPFAVEGYSLHTPNLGGGGKIIYAYITY